MNKSTDFSVSFESISAPGHFLRGGAGPNVRLDKFVNTDIFKREASWVPFSVVAANKSEGELT